MNQQYYQYAELGSSCQSDFTVLTDAHKYFLLNEPEYQKKLTNTMYPLPLVYESNETVSSNEKFETTKTNGCCGKRLYGS